MTQIDPRLTAALTAQLEHRRAVLRQGHKHVGWKLGVGDRERIGGQFAIGYLTSATQIAAGGDYLADDGGQDLRADAEIAVQLTSEVDPGADTTTAAAAVASYAAALEIVDLAPLPDEPGSVVVTNVFHRGVAFGKLEKKLDTDLEAKLIVNGDVRDAAPVPDDLPDRIRAAAGLLTSVGEQLQAGDRIITGSIVQVPIEVGDEVVADLGSLGAVSVRISRVDAAAARRQDANRSRL